ncbi:DUF3108 domain-containing protein [Rhodoferax sp.]|uniref:DUF3108 domain-containing protein n=1 Tax=Rhodoferax sp. TaxID=50421 RepID=UPI002773F690|nr:DUF3108 domain-containing protein [Rhodoferax sp.]
MPQSLVHPKPVVPGVPLGTLLALTGAVLVAHLILLSAPGLDFANRAPAMGRALTTRTIVMPSSTAAPAPPLAPTAAAPRRRATPAARPQPPPGTRPEPAPDLGGNPASAQAPPAYPPDTTALGPTPGDAAHSPEPPSETPPEATPTRPPREDTLSPRTYALPVPARLSYGIEADRFPYTANAEMVWRHDGNTYQATMVIRKLMTVRSQSSVGKVGADGLMPTRFADKTRSEVAAHFDPDGGKVTFSANTPEAALLTGTQDQLSLPLQLAAMVAGEPEKFGHGTTVTIQVVGPRQASLWLLTVEGSETLTLPIGELATLKLQRNPRQPYDQKVELWLAPRYGYLPARIRLTEHNGAYLDQKLQKVEVLD